MNRTQIQLPDELYARAKAFASRREISLAEVTRRGLELFLDRYPSQTVDRGQWVLQKVDGGSVLTALADLRDISIQDELGRSGNRK